MNTETIVIGPLQEQWLQSLEQHPERQMSYKLGEKKPDGSYKACCLGEAGIISGTCYWNEHGQLAIKDEYLIIPIWKGGKAIHTLDGEAYKIMGFNSEAAKASDASADNHMTLAEMNDDGKTWPEIAAMIRKDPSRWFNKSV